MTHANAFLLVSLSPNPVSEFTGTCHVQGLHFLQTMMKGKVAPSHEDVWGE
jgi:hypothetical protein